MSKNILIVAVVVGGIFVLSNVFSNKEENTENPIVENAQSIVVDMPSDMPNVPMYPGSVLERVADQDDDEGVRNITLTLVAEASVSEVNSWYRGALKENGWNIESDRNVGGYILLKGVSDNLSVFTQVANGEEEGTAVITQRIKID